MATKDLKCEIINMEPDPRHEGNTIVSLKIDDGDKDKGKAPYIRAFSVPKPTYPISLEKFAIELEAREMSRPKPPKDPFHYLKQAQKNGTIFTVKQEHDSNADTVQNVTAP